MVGFSPGERCVVGFSPGERCVVGSSPGERCVVGFSSSLYSEDMFFETQCPPVGNQCLNVRIILHVFLSEVIE